MYRNSPKLILKIDLEGDKGLKVSLILLDKYFIDHHTGSNHFFATDGFMIYRGGLLTLFKTGSISLPKNFMIGGKNNSCSLKFDSEELRYRFLKSMKNGLLQWSRSEFWTDFNEPERVALRYNPKVWILF